MTIILLNYAHPLTEEQRAQATALIHETLEVHDIAVQVDRDRPLADVARELAEATGLAPADWQTRPLLVNPPGLAPLALALIADIHGRAGHFPALLNIRPVASAMPPRYEVAEIINLQALRDRARNLR